MIRLRNLVIASMALALITQSAANAGLVISSVATVNNGLATDATASVTVDVYGAPDSASQNVNTFGLKLTLGGLAGATSGLSALNSTTGSWTNFSAARPTPILTANTVTFQGYQGFAVGTNNAIITGAGQTAATKIGTFTFTVAKTALVQNLSITPTNDTALGQSAPAAAPTGVGSGFLVDNGGGFGALNQIVPTTFNVGTGTIAAIVAVPEPTSLALVGVAAIGYLVRRRRIAVHA